jgi:outer membrane protein
MKTKTFFSATSVIVSLIALGISLKLSLTKPHNAYVDLGRLYNEFSMKKELEGQLKAVSLTRENQLDSMKLDLTVLAKNIQSGDSIKTKPLRMDFLAKRQQYALKNQAFTEENDRVSQAYDDEIWKQLNQYIKDFGKENGYRYIFGAEGSGAIMYADDGDNITDLMITYVNAHYKGKQGI